MRSLIALYQYIGVVSAVRLDTPYQLNGDSGCQNSEYHGVYLIPWYQNTMAILLAMSRVKRLGFVNTRVYIIGDNTS